ncbi:MAG: hypothetical protein A3H44_03040 [Gammaproteobacteria bacterium RIFCSPLOWO2_02_FULL_57_10]|nr:MAG: hypothetical protein A3H44_03040 [Gammaproteobacteria bacterium RIFCSPLOWO2_02_FULL_57_10]
MKSNHLLYKKLSTVMLTAAVLGVSVMGYASSHREAPMIAGLPRLDATDLYMFRSYEAGREDFVTILANYFPLQAAYGGPNYFDLETAGLYEIHIDNNGDSVEDITFSFDFSTVLAGVTVPVGGENTAIPLVIAGGVGPGAGDTANVNARQEYTIRHIRGDRRTGTSQAIANASTQATTFRKPLDNIGTKSIPQYADYASSHIYPISIPGCSTAGRVFVGQRQEGFAVNLGQVFDLVNLNPLGAQDAVANPIGDTNVTTLALEVPVSCLASEDAVIGAWTTASLSMGSGEPLQVSRLGFPLVNEVVIGLPDKDKFNSSEPMNDAQFANYVLNPSLPFLLELLFKDAGAVAPKNFPRSDLVLAFGGVPGLNLPAAVAAGTFPRSEMLRLNTGISPKPAGMQMNMGVLAGDTAGFPNGRRPGDDVVDIALRVMMGALISDATVAPNNTAPFTDQTTVSAADFNIRFPYLKDPLPGSLVQQ